MFSQAYQQLKPHVVAIVPRFLPAQTDFPEISGTGFFVDTDGIVCTCRHVVDVITSLPRPSEFQGYAAAVWLMFEVKVGKLRGWARQALEIRAIVGAHVIDESKTYLGPNPPDVSFLIVNAIDTPSVTFSEEPLEEGEWLAFAGYPMGTRLLKAPSWLHQTGPTLHAGLTSAILPYSGVDIPHGFLLHANTQGGASGSPVFRADGKVVGMVYMGINEEFRFGGHSKLGDTGFTTYRVPTNLTGCVPREPIAQVLPYARAHAQTFQGRSRLSDIIAASGIEELAPGHGILKPYGGPETA